MSAATLRTARDGDGDGDGEVSRGELTTRLPDLSAHLDGMRQRQRTRG